MHKKTIVEKVHIIGIQKKTSAQSDEGFRSYGHLKTADSYTFSKYAILVNMETFILG